MFKLMSTWFNLSMCYRLSHPRYGSIAIECTRPQDTPEYSSLLPTPPALALSNPLTSTRAFSHASLIFSLLLSFILIISLH